MLQANICKQGATTALPKTLSRPIQCKQSSRLCRTSITKPSAFQPVKPVAVQQQIRKTVIPQAAASPETSDQGIQWGADLKTLGIAVAVSVVFWFLPAPEGVTLQAWRLLAIFLGTIVGIITTPVPLGAVAMLGLGASMCTGVLTFGQAFSAFSSEIPWLIAIAFWLSQGFIKSGLGNRIAYTIVSLFGQTTLGLTYSLVVSEFLLSPLIPSVAARAGGIFYPLARALCEACGSKPDDGTARKMGAYVMKTCFQCTTVTSGMFITAMAANPLSVNLAANTIGQTISWGTWALAAIVPGITCLTLLPLILYIVYPPENKATPDAPAVAKEELKKLGPLSTNEKITAASFAVTISLWIFGGAIGINNVAAALVGFAGLLITGVIDWNQCATNKNAWDTLTWFAALIGMAAFLNKFGFIAWFSNQVVNVIGGLGLSWQGSFALLTTIYFYSHYLFASGAAHVGAMYTAFLSVAIKSGAPALPAALLLGQVSNMMGCLTSYGIGSAPPYFGSGYVPQDMWYKLGFLASVLYLSVWLGLGSVWWKIIGIL